MEQKGKKKYAITQKFCGSLRANGKDQLYFDEHEKGFGVRCNQNGAITFFLNYSFDGRERRMALGDPSRRRWPEFSVAEALEAAKQMRGQMSGERKSDPMSQREAARTAQTVAEAAQDFLEWAGSYKRSSTLRNDRQMIANIIVPKLGKLKFGSVTRRDIERLHASLKQTPYRANRVLSLLSKMYTRAVAAGVLDKNPVKGIERYHENSRETWLTLEQLEALSVALDKYPDHVIADAVRLLIVTGSREMEVLSADWSQFDLKRGMWTKPSHHTKQKKTEHVPLSDAALAILSQMKRSGRYLFPGADSKSHRVTIRKPWMQILRAAGLAARTTVPSKRKGMTRTIWKPLVRIHDLRHTFASHLVSRGASLQLVGKLLGHTLPSTTQRYAHCAPEALRDVANSFPMLATNTVQ